MLRCHTTLETKVEEAEAIHEIKCTSIVFKLIMLNVREDTHKIFFVCGRTTERVGGGDKTP